MSNQQRTVVIVEDEIEAADMFGEMMRVSGYRVIKSYTSKPAFDLITRETPDLVILDVMMPDISGLDLLKQMRTQPHLAATPAIIVSAKGMPADVKEAMDAGATFYLTKPVGFRELQDAAAKALPPA